ncbi:MAG: hypothetical protein ACJ72G_10565 [Friedmanniella sp.]
MSRLLAVASAAVVTTLTLGVGSASAQISSSAQAQDKPVGEQTAGIEWVSSRAFVKQYDADRAVVQVQYQCAGVGVHLWASLKQGSGVNKYKATKDRPSPPADVARAWYETPEEAKPTCDGASHTLRYTVTRSTAATSTHPKPWKRLRNGRAWAQFVVMSVPEGTKPGDKVEPSREAFAGWVRVVKPRHQG